MKNDKLAYLGPETTPLQVSWMHKNNYARKHQTRMDSIIKDDMGSFEVVWTWGEIENDVVLQGMGGKRR